MIRFKVVKASHLLLIVSILILLCAIAFIAFQGGFQVKNDSISTSAIVHEQTEAKAIQAFASSALPASNLVIEVIPESTISPTPTHSRGNILIYHTHTHEAYEPDETESYAALEAWRTDDNRHNVVQLGAMLADELRALGYEVTHDITDHEKDSLADSYVRALKTLESYPDSFDLCIDLHRDAYVEGVLPCVTDKDAIEYAQLMCLVGRGDQYPDAQKPDYQKNLSFAQRLTSCLNQQLPNLCRNVTVKTGRYNQHIGTISLLIEVGHNKNSLQQAKNSIPILAYGIDAVLNFA